MEYATIDAFLADPVKVWDFYGKRLDVLGEAQPNDGHRALAELEERGFVQAVVTQNVDGLHARAGTRTLVEVHGSLRAAVCLDCGTRVPMGEVAELLPAPACPACGRILKPDVVMFGEFLPEAAIARARRLAAEARLLLVVGSSLEVHPVAGLPEPRRSPPAASSRSSTAARPTTTRTPPSSSTRARGRPCARSPLLLSGGRRAAARRAVRPRRPPPGSGPCDGGPASVKTGTKRPPANDVEK